MHTTTTLLALLTTLTLTLAAPPPTTYTPPLPTLTNGAPNPFYPCPASNISTCPYRCYTLPPGNLTTSSPPTLDAACYSALDASILVASHDHICLRCKEPLASEVPTSPNDTNTCTPAASYFTALNATTAPPPRCGTVSHHLRNCTWDCGVAQVPFAMCEPHDDTGTYEVCDRCVPGCSSPKVVFGVPGEGLNRNFSLSAGVCGSSVNETTACPFRCTDTGNQDYAYCSLVNRTAEFTTCQGCV